MGCPACGQENPEGAQRCTRCGGLLEPPSSRPGPGRPREWGSLLGSKVVWAVALLAAVFLGDSLFFKGAGRQEVRPRREPVSIPPSVEARPSPPARAASPPPQRRPDRIGARALLRRANAEFRRGNLEEALRAYREALELDPSQVTARHNMGVVLGRLGKHAEAVQTYQEVLRREPGHALAHKNLALAYQQMGRREEALAHYRDAIRLRPNFAPAHAGEASLHLEGGDLPRAEASVRRAIEAERMDPYAHYLLGRILFLQGRREAAEAELRLLQRLNPRYAGELARLMGRAVQRGSPLEGGRAR